jgi:hypothetical protein
MLAASVRILPSPASGSKPIGLAFDRIGPGTVKGLCPTCGGQMSGQYSFFFSLQPGHECCNFFCACHIVIGYETCEVWLQFCPLAKCQFRAFVLFWTVVPSPQKKFLQTANRAEFGPKISCRL